MLYLGADHRGFKLKQEIKKYLDEKKIPYQDLGALEYNKDDDYPDFAFAVAKKVAENPIDNKGIVICGSGMGVDTTANKVKGVRASLVWSLEASQALHPGQSNVIALPADFLDTEEAKKIIEIWLDKDGKTLEERHKRRLKKIEAIENN